MKEFFIQHTEKLVLGLCVLVAVWFLYGALTVPQYEKSKQDFEKMIADASRNVNNSEPQLDDLPPLNFDEEVKKLDVTIDSKDYQLPTPFIRPMELGFQFRGTPEILKPEPPEVQVNRGLVVLQERDAKDRGNLKVFQKLLGQNFPAELIWFTGNQDMVENLGIVEVEEKAGPARPQAAGRQNRRGGEVGDGRTEVRRSAKGVIWVEVVAAFPHADQIREYIRSVKEGAEEAGVRYALSEIQRQELTPDLEWSPWQRIAWQKEFDLYEQAQLDDPDQEFPPGSVVNGLVMYSPDRVRVGGGTDGSRLQMHPDLVPSEFLSIKEPIWTPAELDPRAKPEELEIREREEVVGDPMPRERQRRNRGTSTNFDNFSDVETAMMRAYDFTVEPGKRYRYRIRAVAYNPNFNRVDVLDPNDALKPLLFGEWSDPSEEVYVQPDTVLAVADNRSNLSDRLEITVYNWIERAGVWVSLDFTHSVGQIIGAGTNKPVDVPQYDANKNSIDTLKQPVDRDTSSILLEISEGKVQGRLPSGEDFTIQPPKEIVVVNEYGDLIRHTELEDMTDPDRLERDNYYQQAKSGKGGSGGGGREPNKPSGNDSKDKDTLTNPFANMR